jgi:hypothetical protein
VIGAVLAINGSASTLRLRLLSDGMVLQNSVVFDGEARPHLRLDFPMWGRAKLGPPLRTEGFKVSDAIGRQRRSVVRACRQEAWGELHGALPIPEIGALAEWKHIESSKSRRIGNRCERDVPRRELRHRPLMYTRIASASAWIS